MSGTSTVSTYGRIIVSAMVISGFYAIVFFWLWRPPAIQSEALTLMVGAASTTFGLVVGYWIGSSAGSSDKDRNTSETMDKLVHAVSTSAPSAVQPRPWWANMTDEEKSRINSAANHDPKVKDFMDHAAAGTATPEELAYVVKIGLITQDRAAALSALK